MFRDLCKHCILYWTHTAWLISLQAVFECTWLLLLTLKCLKPNCVTTDLRVLAPKGPSHEPAGLQSTACLLVPVTNFQAWLGCPAEHHVLQRGHMLAYSGRHTCVYLCPAYAWLTLH